MIRPLHRRVIQQACAVLKIDAEALHPLLRRWGNVDRLDDLGATGYGRLLDIFVLRGLRTRNRPVLSPETLERFPH